MLVSDTSHPSNHRLTLIGGVPDFWERVRDASHRLLAVDYDGTLAPFRVDRDRAVPLKGVHDALARIRDLPGTTLAIYSGRPAGEVVTLLGSDLQVPIYGAHGFEYVPVNGSIEAFSPTTEQVEGVKEAIARAKEAGFGHRLEKKTGSVALHTRGTAHAEQIELRFLELWKSIAQDHGLALMQFNRGVELRALGRNKGTALNDLYVQMPVGTLPIYIGDDTTDEDAFRFVKTCGIGIKVGDGDITEAAGRVPDEKAVLRILQDWPRALGAP